MRTAARLAALVALVALAGGCSGAATQPVATPTSSSPTVAPTTAPSPTVAPTTAESSPTAPASPSPSPSASPTAAPSPPGAEEVTVFLVRDAAGSLWVEPVTVALQEPTLGVARAAMTALFRGGAPDPALGTPANPATEVLGADIDGGVLTVDVSAAVREPAQGSAAEAAFAQQLAHTGAQFDGVDAVRLRVEGQPITELWGHLDWSQPFTPDPFALSPVTVTEPAWGASVPVGEVIVAGEANVFEATVALRLLGPDGAVVEETFTTATCGTGCRGTWSHTFSVPTAGRWTVEAAETDPSDGEGRPPFTVRVPFEVG